jgi:hypothetical protein
VEDQRRPSRRRTRRPPRWVLAGAVLALLIGAGALVRAASDQAPDAGDPEPELGVPEQDQAASEPDGSLGVRVLSNRADLLSGGDALVEVVLPEGGVVPPRLRVGVDGRDVTDAFDLRPGDRFLGLVTGLERGRNTLTARAPGFERARIRLTNHPIGGPVFAGEQVQPWRCATESNGLGPARDEQCNTPAVYELYYRSVADDDFLPYDPGNPPPAADIATVTTDHDQTVPYIVRRERGVINRGIYDIAVLYEPGADWEPWAPQPAWNRKVFWTFGGSCQPYHAQEVPEGRPDRSRSPGVFDDQALSRGFAVASSAHNVLGNNCNTVVSAEALMMVKEHLIETYGPVRYTFGIGGSGGSISILQVAEAYPGLLDGVIVRSTFPDLLSTVTENFDCRLLQRYFRVTSSQPWSPDAMQAALGHGLPGTCNAWVSNFSFAAMFGDPTVGCTTPLRAFRENDRGQIERDQPEADWVYDPEDNPGGVRCTLFDYMAPVFGRRDGDGIALRPYDNVGVQYGLEGLLDGRITPEQFVDLNTSIGGFDLDYRFQPQRVGAARRALDGTYASGQVTSGHTLARVPIIDASYVPIDGKMHTAFHSWKLRERLIAANGTADNHAIIQDAGERRMFRLMDRWLTAIEADSADGTRAERVVRNRPARAANRGRYGGTSPRIAAGGPLRDDVLKCRLQPLDRNGYGDVSFTDEQWTRLQTAFAEGVCDWTQPGVGQTPTVPWLTYAGDRPEPLGDPPGMETR